MLECPSCGAYYSDQTGYCSKDGTRLVEGDSQEEHADGLGQVLGSYRLLSVLGRGGMGTVFAAEHVRLGRKVAIKQLRPEFASDTTSVRRFFAEARAVNQIAHENIVQITDFIEDQGSTKFYVMELLEGPSLAEELKAKGALPIERTLWIAAQVADALQVVHDSGFVHRDLKPANLILTESGGRSDVVKILDFGVAKLTGSTAAEQTAAGMVFGSPAYIAPDYLATGHADHRCDIYALGVIMYEMVAGQRPFTANTMQALLREQLTREPSSPSSVSYQEVSPALDDLIMSCLEKEPQERPQSMDEVKERLLAVADQEQVDLTMSAAFSRSGRVYPPLARKKSRSRRRLALVLASGVLVGTAGYLVWRGTGQEAPASAGAVAPAAPAKSVVSRVAETPAPSVGSPSGVAGPADVAAPAPAQKRARARKRRPPRARSKNLDPDALYDPFAD